MCLAKIAQKSNEEPKFSDFNSIEVDDKKTIQRYTDRFKPLSCEYSFANLYCWQEPYNTTWSIYKERLVIYSDVNKFSFFPIGKEMTPQELVFFSQEMQKKGLKGDIGVVPSQYLEKYPEAELFYTITEERGCAEYLYSVEALSDLKGVKLHKKKNLISQFHTQHPNSSIKLMTGKFKKASKVLADEIFNSHERFLSGIEDEHIALMKAFDEFEEIDLEGLVLLVGDDVVAFSIFSPLTHDTYDIHFEKSCYHFKGAAQVINHETAKYLREKCKYVNREQDLGIQGLRQAKMSYDPETLLRFHRLDFKGYRPSLCQ